MKKLSRLLVTAFLAALVLPVFGGVASAAFDKNYLISDSIFDSGGSMSASQIDAFLNARSSCISPNSGFTAKKPTGYSPSGGFTYGSYVSAGTVIATAASVYNINPRVLLVTLQKEQSLVSASSSYCNDGDEHKYAAAMGYGCPDGGSQYSYKNVSLYRRNGVLRSSTGTTCVNNSAKAGFSQQVIRGAWLLKFGQQRSRGNVDWAIIEGSWDNSDDPQSCYSGPMTRGTYRRCPSGSATFFDGYTVIDGSTTRMGTGATAALYWYTPHFHGNQNFVSLYEGWFGSTKFGYAADMQSVKLYTDSARTNEISGVPSIESGTVLYATVVAKNVGSKSWKNSFVRVGTRSPYDRSSVFRNGDWLSSGRPGKLSESNVNPGSNGTFNFSLTAPATDGTYVEKFRLVAEGRQWMDNAALFDIPITVSNPYNGRIISKRAYSDAGFTKPIGTSVKANGVTYWKVTAKNIGTNTWNQAQTKIGTWNLQDRISAFQHSSWLSGSRPANLKESSVAPGAIGTFEYIVEGPASPTISSETFRLLVEGVRWMPLPSYTDNIKATANLDRLLRGERLVVNNDLRNGGYRLVMQGDGNLVVYNTANKPGWYSGTKGGDRFVMQGDGNLVIYNAGGKALWSSGTKGGDRLIMQGDGNLVIYNAGGKALWSSGTK